MKLRILILCTIFTLTSCKDNNKQQKEVEILTETEAQTVDEEKLDTEHENVIVAVEGNPELSTFAQSLNATQVIEDFVESEGPYTIFAPSNLAYSELNQEERDLYLGTENEAYVNYLVIAGYFTTDILKDEIKNADGEYILNTMQGEDIIATLNNDAILLTDALGNTATIVEPDISAVNGMVHVIDSVLLPVDPATNEAALDENSP